MKLFEFRKNLPQSAGNARLKFCDMTLDKVWEKIPDTIRSYTAKRALRKGATIYLDNDPNAEFFPLLKRKQFIYVAPGSREDDAMFFGGQDEEPFLVRLKITPYRVFMSDGEEAFFESLCPPSL